MSPIILAATLIMSNKLIDKERIKELWEEIKMLDVLDVAREKGLEEGKAIGIKEGKELGIKEGKELGVKEGKELGVKVGVKEGKIEAAREMLLDALFEKFNNMPPRISQQIRNIQNHDTLKYLFRQVLRCDDMETFEAVLSRLE